ncbi:lycopene cyclase domain-containing protein [Fulvivirga sp. 29W222]|uniref:Lycopene cyclase domain-containing protein n=1 Tax=Fulvivirga marina TaxID=2494733 RepID=A0A937FZR2_9BACT|nr:lycopene cyclase domain-containing protein [Fulvivirga marina]MBL6447997.1 lycopene cyclase domain-containing protein [Fulvivirga marina]
MDSHYLYLLLNSLAIAVPLAFSFYPRANFSKKWQYLMPAIAVPGTIFILWDVYFTKWGIWGFNETYLTGVDIANLPVEEWLFFICIPYACVFTYFSFKYLFKHDYLGKYASSITWALIVMSFLIAVINVDRAYTSATFFALCAFLLVHVFILKSAYLGRFYFSFIFILIPFFLINGILTGSFIEDQVVWYNNSENLGIRMGTIPVEDTFYGMLLLLMNVTLFEELENKPR